MKRLIMGFISGALFVIVSMPLFAITKSQIYQRFGPKMLEAMVLVIRDEINILRSVHGLPERTNDQIIDALQNKYNSISD